jgi:hypothetical protein
LSFSEDKPTINVLQKPKVKMKKKSLLFGLLMLASAYQLSAQEETYSPSVRPVLPQLMQEPAPRPYDITVLEKSLISSNQRAQLFMRFSSQKLNGHALTFTATDGSHTVQKIVNTDVVLITLNINKTYLVSYQQAEYTLPDINTNINSEIEALRISDAMLAALVTNLDYKAGKQSLIQALDEARNVSYFEKLQVLQKHYLNEGVGLPDNYLIDDNTLLTPEIIFKKVNDMLFARNGKKTRGDDPVWPWDKTPLDADLQLDPNGNPVWPRNTKPCYATLLLKHSPDISNYSGHTPQNLPYKGADYARYYGLHAARSGAQQATVYEDYDTKGAAVSLSLGNDGYSNSFTVGHDSSTKAQNSNFQSLIYSLLATDGLYYSKACGCEKRIKLSWRYNTEITAKAEMKGFGFNINKSAGAHAKDVAVASIVSLDDGKVQVIDAKSLEVQRTCGKTLNPDWTKTTGALVKDIITVVGAIAQGVVDKGDDPKKDIDWLSVLASTYTANSSNVADIYTNLITLFGTSLTTMPELCGSSTENNMLINKSHDAYISPGETFAFILSSEQEMEVTGRKGWESATSILSSGYITTYVYPKGTPFGIIATEKECCSRQMAEWLQTSHTTAAHNSNLFSIGALVNALGYSWDAQYTTLGTPNAVHNWGAMFGAKPTDCKLDIKIQGDGGRQAALSEIQHNSSPYIATNSGINNLVVPVEFVGSNYRVYDALGKMVASGIVHYTNNQLPIFYNKGLYVVQLENQQHQIKLKLYNE